MSVKDFTGHELQVGDIAITGALEEFVLDWVRIVEIDQPLPNGYASIGVRALGYDLKRRLWRMDSTQLIWHSSDYKDAPDGYVAELFQRGS